MQLSIIIPTFNEARNLQRLLPYLYQHADERLLEILVADSCNSTDDSAAKAMELGAKVICCERVGRANQMNIAAQAAKGDVLYFVHADVLPPPNYLDDIEHTLQKDVDFGCFSYRFDSQHLLLRINAYFTRFDGLFAGGGDQTLFIKREVFKALNGFDENWCIMEDFEFTKRAKRAGYVYEIVPEDAVVSARKYQNNSYLRVTFSNLWVFVMYWLGSSPVRIKARYRKLLS